MTAKDEDVSELVRAAVRRGATVVAAGGGDGTVNAVASVLVGTETTLGVLPLGTLNHFAKDIGIPLEMEEALAVLRDGKVQHVDVGTVSDRIFINNSGLGLYPDMVFNRERRQNRARPNGLPSFWRAYVHSVAIACCSWRFWWREKNWNDAPPPCSSAITNIRWRERSLPSA